VNEEQTPLKREGSDHMSTKFLLNHIARSNAKNTGLNASSNLGLNLGNPASLD